MKLSLKVEDSHHHRRHHQTQDHVPLLLRAKVPITVFGLPFLSGVAASEPSDISVSLRTNFLSGPSLKVTYNPTYTTAATSFAGNTANSPLAVTLKSGVSLFGSPNNSPLIISANFAISPQNPNPNPTFFLQIKPQFGNFSLRKTTSSSANPNPKDNSDATSMGFVPLERPMPWSDLTTQSTYYKDSLLSGIAVTAKTELPLTKRIALNFRWGVNFPSDFGKQLPSLTVNKIGIEKIDELVEVAKEVELKKSIEGNAADFELLKVACLSMRREMEVLQKENSEVKKMLQETMYGKFHMQGRTYDGVSDGISKKAAAPMTGNSREQWKAKKGTDQDNGHKESSKKGVNRPSDLESELQRAIKAASSQ